MAIPGMDLDCFKEVLRSNLTPARAISDPAHLRGREQRLTQIDRTFNSPGKHVFIYGDRGVGKTSLAQTAATIHQSSDNAPVTIACDQYIDFYKLVGDIARSCLPSKDVIEQRTSSKKGGFRIPGISYEMQQGLAHGVVPPIESLNDAVILLKYIANLHSKDPVIIVDEFDQTKSSDDKKRFADLIKQVSDQEVPIRFIFCGIAATLEELIGVHLSTDRYIAPIELSPLSQDSLWEILDVAAGSLGVSIGREENIRIARISDGFPYYVHLAGEHIFWSMFDDDVTVDQVNLGHFDRGIRGAISEAVATLKQAYELAVQKKADDYEEVLWSVADGAIIDSRPAGEIYDKSYLPIMTERKDRKPLGRNTFYRRMNNLKSKGHGEILVGTKLGRYSFRENWMRGYVRLKAEENDVVLGIDHHLAKRPRARTIKIENHSAYGHRTLPAPK